MLNKAILKQGDTVFLQDKAEGKFIDTYKFRRVEATYTTGPAYIIDDSEFKVECVVPDEDRKDMLYIVLISDPVIISASASIELKSTL